MPDDQIVDEQVAEQPVVDPVVDDKASNEEDAFAADDESTEQPTGLERKDVKAEPEKKPDEPEKKPEDSEEKQDGEKPPEDEDDEDIKRGKEIIAAQQKAEDDRKKAEEEANAKKGTDDTVHPQDLTSESWAEKDIKEIFAPAIPKNFFPKDPVKIDGVELDFQHVLKEFPEIPHMVFMLANNMVRQMMKGGAIVDGNTYKSDKETITKSLDTRDFVRTVTHPVYGVKAAKTIVNSDEFKTWIEKQPDEIKALRSSGSPWDYIAMLKRYQNKEVLGNAKQQAEEADAKRVEKKKTVDGIFKSQKNNPVKPKADKVNSQSPDDELEAFNSDDDEDKK